MSSGFTSFPAALHLNRGLRSGPYGDAERAILSRAAAAAARAQISHWPGYAATPLRPLPVLAGRLAVARIDYKDEAGRFGLGSFKALGGAYAVCRLLVEHVGRATGTPPSASDLLAGRHRVATRDLTVTCATDGNHGRSVAWAAKMFGCRCVIYLHATVSAARTEAIARYGAEIVRVPGTYDDAVRAAAAAAARLGWLVVSDTSYSGYMDVPRDVMQGYTVMVDEALDQLAAEAAAPPSHVFVQGGVGGLAAAVTAHLWESFPARRPCVVVVEPVTAACLFASAEAGYPVPVGGDLDTIMAGLACGEVSPLAWSILAPGATAFMTIVDAAAEAAMCLLAGFDPPVVAGESAVAGLAGLLCLAERPHWRSAIGLDTQSTVLLIGSEGDTDPDSYRRIVGRAAASVRADDR